MAEKMSAWTAYQGGYMILAPGYGLQHSADVLLLRRGDGSIVAAFSARGIAPAEVARVAEEDRRAANGKNGA